MKTKEILEVWRMFLNENKFTSVKYKEGQKVKIKICCNGCAKAASTKKFTAENNQLFNGTVVAPDLRNRNVKFDGSKKNTKVNFVMVDIGKQGEQSFPQCCVDLGMKKNKKKKKPRKSKK